MLHALRYLQIVEQTTQDHLEKMYMDLNYWSMFIYQERNNNKFFNEEFVIIRKLAGSHLSLIDAGIQLSYLNRMYYSQSGYDSHPVYGHRATTLSAWNHHGGTLFQRPRLQV